MCLNMRCNLTCCSNCHCSVFACPSVLFPVFVGVSVWGEALNILLRLLNERCSCLWLLWLWLQLSLLACCDVEAIQWSQHRVRTLAVAITNRDCYLQSFGSRHKKRDGRWRENLSGKLSLSYRNFEKVKVNISPFIQIGHHRSVYVTPCFVCFLSS